MQHTNRILFITRKWRGWGGMQQLSRDLWRGMKKAYGERAKLVVLGFPISLPLGGRVRERGSNSSIHIHLGDAALVPLGWLLKKIGARRVTVTVCGLDVIWPKMWYQWVLKRTLPQMDHVVCISNATAEEVKKRGVGDEKISVIPCGVWPLCHGEPDESMTHNVILCRAQDDMYPKLLTVGRLVKRKGHVWFIEHVLPTLIHIYPKLEYWIVGEGPERQTMESIIRNKKLEGHVRLFGAVSDDVRKDVYANADIFVMPNILVLGDMEGFGIAAIEASSRGVPVVAARLDGLKDAVIEGKTGRFFESENTQDCCRVIQDVLKFPPPWGDWAQGEGVKEQTIQHFSWTYLFQRYQHEVFHV